MHFGDGWTSLWCLKLFFFMGVSIKLRGVEFPTNYIWIPKSSVTLDIFPKFRGGTQPFPSPLNVLIIKSLNFNPQGLLKQWSQNVNVSVDSFILKLNVPVIFSSNWNWRATSYIRIKYSEIQKKVLIFNIFLLMIFIISFPC